MRVGRRVVCLAAVSGSRPTAAPGRPALRTARTEAKMSAIVVVFGVAVGLLGVSGAVHPAGLIRFVERMWQSPTGFRLAIALRLVLGVVLIVAAPDCRFPRVIRFLGILSLVAGATGAALGRERLQSFIRWWVRLPSGWVRGWSLVAVAFGFFLAYAAS